MPIQTILITEENQMDLAERFGIDDDYDEILPIGYVVLTEPEDNDDYDLIQVMTN